MKGPSLRINVLANYGGQVALAVVGLAVVPFYIKYLGPEGFGLVGFVLAMQAVIGILDLGLSATANREISRLSAESRQGEEGWRLVRTLEYLYYGVAGLLTLGFLLGSGFIARYWLGGSTFDSATIDTCALLAGASIAARWPIALYYGVHRGLERQVRLNLLTTFLAIAKGIGSVLILKYVSPTPIAFYAFQLGFAGFETCLAGGCAWWLLGGFFKSAARFDRSVVARVWRYSFSVGWASVFAMLLKQVDKLVISKMLPMADMGYYTTAVIAGMGVGKVFQPIQTAVFPRFSKLHAQGKQADLTRVFHQASQACAFVATPAACALSLFPFEILRHWTGSVAVATQAEPALCFTALAMLFNAMMSVPLMLQLALGLTRIPLWTNALGALALLPASWILVKTYGAAGGGMGWLLFNLAYYLAVPQVLFGKALRGEKARWYFKDTAPFMLAGLAAFWLTAHLFPEPGSLATLLVKVCAASAAFALASLTFSDTVRAAARLLLGRCAPQAGRRFSNFGLSRRARRESR